MQVSCEWLGGILRVHPEGGSHLTKSPYSLNTTIVPHGTKAELRGLSTQITVAEGRAIAEWCKAHGFTEVWWERLQPDGTVRVHRRTL